MRKQTPIYFILLYIILFWFYQCSLYMNPGYSRAFHTNIYFTEHISLTLFICHILAPSVGLHGSPGQFCIYIHTYICIYITSMHHKQEKNMCD